MYVYMNVAALFPIAPTHPSVHPSTRPPVHPSTASQALFPSASSDGVIVGEAFEKVRIDGDVAFALGSPLKASVESEGITDE